MAVLRDLMRRAQDGDQDAYRTVLRQMLPLIQMLARRRVKDATLADDVVQDSLLTLHRVRHTYDPGRPVEPWLTAIVSARAIDALRRQGRARLREISDACALDNAPDDGASPLSHLGEPGHDIKRLLGVLPQRQRAAVELVKLREMTLSEAAAATGASIPTLKSLLHRAYLTLRAQGKPRHD